MTPTCSRHPGHRSGTPTTEVGRRVYNASAPRMSTASSVTFRWYSLQYSFEIAPSGPGWCPARNCVSVRWPRKLHDLDLRVAPGQSLADDRVVGEAALAGHLDEAVEFGLVADRPGRCGLAPLESEQRHGDGPAVVDAADDVVLRAAGIGVEHLVELALARDHLDRTHLDARLIHRHEQERDALVLRRVGVGAGEGEDVVGEVTGRGPDLLAVQHPLVAVEFGPEADVAEVGAGVGLGVALAPRVLAGQDPRQVVRASVPRSPTSAACCRASGCRRRRWGRRSARRLGRTPRRGSPARSL